MNPNGDERRTLTLIAVITVAGFAAWMALLGLLWVVLDAAGTAPDFWAMTEAMSTAAAVTAVLVAGYVAYRELTEVSSTRHMEVADRLFAELNAPENIEARRWVYQNLDADLESGLADLSEEGQAAIKRVLNSLDRVAFLTQAGWIPEEMVMPWMNPMIVKAWAKLEPYVDYESARRREPDYYQNVRALAEDCRHWRQANLPEAEVTWLQDAL